MQNVLILGGGVGGTLVANLISRKIKKQIDAGEAKVTVVDETGEHVYQPGFMYIAMGDEDPKSLRKPERRCSTTASSSSSARSPRSTRRPRRVALADGTALDYDYLVLATGSRILPEAIEHFEEEAHHFYSDEAAAKLRHALDAFTGGKVVVGIAGDALQVPAGAARGGLPHRGRAARARPARQERAPLLLARSRAPSPSRSVSEMATPELEKKGIELHTFFNVEAIDPERKVVAEPRGRGARVRPADPGAAAQGRAGADGQRHRARAGRLAADRPQDAQRRRTAPNVWALGDATDLPLSKAGSTAHFEAPVVAERVVGHASRAGSRTPRTAIYTGKVMCFFEVGDGKGTLLHFDYENPPKPPKPNRLWHVGKIVFNKTYYRIVPKGRGGTIEKRL